MAPRPSTARTTSKESCGTRLPKGSRAKRIGEPAIGRRVLGAFLGEDERIRLLRFVATMRAHRERREIKLATVSPDAAHEGDRTFAEADRQIAEIAVGCLGGLGAAAQRPLPPREGERSTLVVATSSK